MMIPPVVGATPPAQGTDTPGDGFAEAIAAALGINPVPAVQPNQVPEVPEQAVDAATDVAVPAPAPYTAMPDQIARLVGTAAGAVVDAQPVAAPTAEAVEAIPDAAAPVIAAPEPAPDVAAEITEVAVGTIDDTEQTDAEVAPDLSVPDSTTEEGAPIDDGTAPVAAAASAPPSTAPSTVSAPTDAPPEKISVEAPAMSNTRTVEKPEQAPVEAPTQDVAEFATDDVPTTETDHAVRAPSERRSEPAAAIDSTRPTEQGGEVQPSSASHVDGGTTSERPGHVPATTLHRVETAIRHLENAPPPKTITITVDDQGLHRVTVSVHADGVRLSVPDGATTDTQLITDLEQSLESRGFDLSGRNHERGRHQRPDESDSFIPTAPGPRTRPTASDGVRI